ncbi:flavodoxin family protein [Aquimarina hainanensis]|uniref:Flavodoxin family protein n=2 Tax=Aquimarina hainanensis TaxID=1578017 RepID=A0ABW5N8R6_9FLAO|nr:NAD(P)H-dependent oxidoreductase [Aquimarina sp. TRL1]QKX05506.1 NAD(P)H-dependent oxidoreductase [Aquimarina sp. TRL1]
MLKKGIIIQGSANSKGNTNKAVVYFKDKTGFDFIDLKCKDIAPFDYEFKNKYDDFLPLIKDIAQQYEVIVFATPVYWYSMSGILKNFFDRISDCLMIEKETGRQFRGKKIGVISSSSDGQPIEGFEMPFRESANYLGMEYLGSAHTWVEEKELTIKAKERLTWLSEVTME